MSAFLRVLENEVQVAALLFMAAVYTARLVWLFHFRSAPERTFPAGNAGAGTEERWRASISTERAWS